MLRLMGHLIPVSNGLEKISASETDSSIVSSASTLKRRLHNLPPSSEASVKLADRVAALNQRIRRERDLYLHLQGSTNRIDEKDEVDFSATDSSKTIDLTSNRHQQGLISDARARRRDRLNSDSAMSHRQISSDLQICSPGFSSPEPLELREIREDWNHGTDQLSSPVKEQYFSQNDPFVNGVEENVGAGSTNAFISQEFEMANELLSSWQNASQFSHRPYGDWNSADMVNAPLGGNGKISNFDCDDANYFKDRLTNCNSLAEAEDTRTRAPTSSTASSSGVYYPYMTRKKAPKKFGGYRPSPGLIVRNLSSDSESDVTLDRIDRTKLRSGKYRRGNMSDLEIYHAEEQELRDSDFIPRNSSPDTYRVTEVEPFSTEKIEPHEDRRLSPIPSVGSRHSFEYPNPRERMEIRSEVQIRQETQSAPLTSDGRNRCVDGYIGNVAKQNTLPDANADYLPQAHSMGKSFPKSFSEDRNPRSETSLKPTHHIIPKSIENAENLRNPSQSHGYVLADDDYTHPKIPPLEIDSHGYSQSHSSSSENIGDETASSSLDVNALIKALSDVSLKQKNSTDCTKPSKVMLKSTLGYGSRLSGSSGPISSEYTPAVGGSRQSLTSLEVSETYSVKISKEESMTLRRARPLLKSDEQKSASKTPEVLKDSSYRPPPNIKKSLIVRSSPPDEPKLEIDSCRGNSFIPVVAKVDRTNLVCSKHPLKIRSISKLISPRKYRNPDTSEGISDPPTTRTDASQSSDGSRKSSRSLKSTMHEKRMDEFKGRMNSTSLSAPISSRRVLEPLSSVAKIQADLLTSMNQRIERRRKTANALAEIINSQSEGDGERMTTRISSGHSSRRSPLSRTNRADLPIPRFTQRVEYPVVQQQRSTTHRTALSSGRKTPGEPFDDISRPSTEENHKLLENAIKGQKLSGVSNGRSSVTPGHASSLRQERLSMSSGDYGGKRSWSPSPRNEDLTENRKTYDSEVELHEIPNANCRKMSEAMDLDAESFPTNPLASSSGNCVYLNHLQDGREVTLKCGNAEYQKTSLGEIEIFNRLPNEIIGSLTRRASFGTRVTEDPHPTKEAPSTIQDLRRNIQENNDRWIKDLKSDDDSENSVPGSPDTKFSSQSRNSLSNPMKNSQEISTVDHGRLPQQKSVAGTENSRSRSRASGKIDRGRSDDECSSSPLYKCGIIRRESEDNSEADHLDSQRSSLIHSGIDERDKKALDLSYTDAISNLEDDVEIVEAVPSRIGKSENCISDAVANSDCESKLESLHNFEQDCEKNEERSCDQDNRFANELEDRDSPRYPAKRSEDGFRVCEKGASPSSAKSSKSQTVTGHRQDGIISSSVSLKSSLSMSKLNSSAESKCRDATVVTGANGAKKSQDRFPFTISESTGRKTSKFQVVADVSLDRLIQDQNADTERNDRFPMQKPIVAKSGDQRIATTETIDAEKRIECCEESPNPQLTQFLEEIPGKISNDSPGNWEPQTPCINLNYMSYGCREEPRTLMPTVKEMVKKLSARLGYARTKRSLDPEEAMVNILYKNNKCLYESGEGSSTATSLYQSQFLNTSNKLVSSFLRRSNNGSRASSGKTMKPKRNQLEYISMSLQHSPRRGCDRNDLWIQEFDSDVEFDALQAPTVAYCQMQDDLKRETMPRTSSPVLHNDRYSIFLARRKFFGTTNDVPNHREGGDSEKVNCNKKPGDLDEGVIEVPEMVPRSPRTPANSFNDKDKNDEFGIHPRDDKLEKSTAKSGCCCFRIYHLIVGSRKRTKTKIRGRIKSGKKK